MAVDKTEPRISLILKIGATAIAGFIVTRVGLVAYFDSVTDEEEYAKVGRLKNPLLTEVREWEKAQLSSGPMPIDKSMTAIAEKGRMAMPQIEPKQSTDTAPLECWKMMPCAPPASMLVDAGVGAPAEATTAAPNPTATTTANVPAAGSDGGGGHP
jgi:hypothetical protein